MDKDKLLELSGVQLNSASIAYVEALHEDFVMDPNSVPQYWQEVFKKLEPNQSLATPELSHSKVRAALRNAAHYTGADSGPATVKAANRKQIAVIPID